MEEAHPGAGAAFMAKFASLSLKDDEASTKEFLGTLRGMMDGEFAMLGAHPVFAEAGEKTIETELKVPTCHGGGAVGGTVEQHKPVLDFMAINGNVVVFNVD